MPLHFTHDEEIVSRWSSFPDDSLVAYIGNYPSEPVLESIDVYCRQLRPHNENWDDVINTGGREDGSGYKSTGFVNEYKERLSDQESEWQMRKLLYSSIHRPVYIGHHPRKREYSPAGVLIDEIQSLDTIQHTQ